MASSEKGNLSTDIGKDVIEEALRSVEKRRAPADGDAPPAEDAGVELDPTAAEAFPAGAAEPSASSQEVAALKAQLEFSQSKGRELMDKLKDEHERLLRAVADLENFKKRAAKEKEEVQRFGSEKLLKDFLPVIDNLDRALDHAKNPSDFDSLVKGIKMTRKIFEDTLGRHGVKGFSAVGQAFDPRLHEAMQQQETSDMPPNQVFAEVLRGYTLNDRLVRPALVMVSKAPAAAAAAPAAGSTAPDATGAATGSKPENGS